MKVVPYIIQAGASVRRYPSTRRAARTFRAGETVYLIRNQAGEYFKLAFSRQNEAWAVARVVKFSPGDFQPEIPARAM